MREAGLRQPVMDQKTDDSGMATLKMQPGGSAQLIPPKKDQGQRVDKEGTGAADAEEVESENPPPTEVLWRMWAH